MDDLEFLKKKKQELAEQQVEIDRQIKVAEVKQEQDRQANLVGLLRRVSSMIKTSSSSFSEISIGEVIEYAYEQGHKCADAYSRTIDVEICGRVREENGPIYATTPDDLKRFSMTDEATLVVSYLIPYELVKNDPFFKENAK